MRRKRSGRAQGALSVRELRERWIAGVVVVPIVVACAAAAPSPPVVEPSRSAPPPPTPSVAAPSAAPSPRAGVPATRRSPVTDTYHGVDVVDEYRWLEDGASAEVKAWTLAQNGYARSVLDVIPGRAGLAARVAAALGTGGVRYPALEAAGKRWFVLVDAPPKQQRFVVVAPAGGSPKDARVLVDPNALDPSGKTAVDWFRPSPDGKLLAVSVSKAGSELGEVSVYDVESGKPIPDVVPRVNGGTAGGDVAWAKDGRGFFYTRYPAEGERPPEDLPFYQQLYFHELGKPVASDRYELGKDFPRIAEIQVTSDARTGRLLATVQKGDGGEFAHFLRDPRGAWRKLADFGDGIAELEFDATTDDLLAITRKNAPLGALLRVDGHSLDVTRARVLVPEQENALVSDFWHEGTLVATPRRLYSLYQRGGPSEIRVSDARGAVQPFQPPLDVAAYEGLRRDGAGVLFSGETFLRPPTWFSLDEKTGQARATAFASVPPIDLSPYGVVRDDAQSKDGTRVPFSVLTPRDFHADGSRACVVTGYGGYGMNIAPRYKTDSGVWLERGVVHVVANLRGGGEFGEAWHQAGNLENKQHVFDDFAAVLAAVAEKKYCDAARIGIIGGSNGGLLMGATLTQHPELVRAVVSFVGIYDMLRVELQPNGAFNTTEFGTVKDPAQFRALRAYSPYHHVQAGALYPPTLLLTGENDPRVDPNQSRKMTALLQAKTAGHGPILLRTSFRTGHGQTTDLAEQIAQKTDAFAFMLDALGVPLD